VTRSPLQVAPARREVLANGLRHHLLEWDGGGRTTLLCLHGFLDMAWGFAPVAPAPFVTRFKRTSGVRPMLRVLSAKMFIA